MIAFLLVCMWGGIYEFSAAFYGAVFAGILFLIYQKRKELRISLNFSTYGIGMLFLCYVCSVLAARDKGTAFLGCLKILSIVLFWMMWMQFSSRRKEELFQAIPHIGTATWGIALPTYAFPELKEHFYIADRLGGVFQYSNTYALFLLSGIIILFFRTKWKRKEKAEVVFLLTGIVFTGSRSVFVLTVIILLFLILKEKEKRLEKLAAAAAAAAAVMICQCVLLHLDIERLGKLTLQSSTLNGRFLYWMDAFPLIFRYPLGLGYMGYYYLQPQFQTGCYVTKFVHNDILQTGLDAGVLAMLVLSALILLNIFTKKNNFRNRLILSVLFLHSLFDFDLQFTSMFCILLMCFPVDGKKMIVLKRNWVRAAGAAACGICLYFSLALGLSYVGKNELSLYMYPYNTSVRLETLYESESQKTAELITEQNGMSADAYEVLVKYAVAGDEYEDILDYTDKMLECAGYESYYYNQAVYYLSFALDRAVRAEDMGTAAAVIERIKEVPERIEERKARTSALAWRINDKPEIELEEEIKTYIEQVEKIQL